MASADNEEVEVVNKLVDELKRRHAGWARAGFGRRDASEDDRIRGHGIGDTRDARDARPPPCRVERPGLRSSLWISFGVTLRGICDAYASAVSFHIEKVNNFTRPGCRPGMQPRRGPDGTRRKKEARITEAITTTETN